jgi:hypothetical protein
MTALETVNETPPGRSLLEARTVHRTIPLRRIVTTELRKMFDTRAGFWLMARPCWFIRRHAAALPERRRACSS